MNTFRRRVSRVIVEPRNAIARLLGSEDVHAPASWNLLSIAGLEQPDIVHGHNLHGVDYFDIRALPLLSHRVPLVLTLHDGWLLSGHCAHSLECDRWERGCGNCPDLTLYPAIRRDATAANFRRKHDIFARTRAYISAPSKWLLDRASRSHLASAMVDRRVIPNSVDTSIFAPTATRFAVRADLNVPAHAAVLLFVAPRGALNRWKDYATLRAAVERLGAMTPSQPTVCLVLGNEALTERLGSVELRYLAPEVDPGRVARLYQAADLYVHAARADTFPLTVLEALACGTPVVATAVGGVSEQVRHFAVPGLPVPHGVTIEDLNVASGVLVPAGDADSLAGAIRYLLADDSLRAQLAANARGDASLRFGHDREVDAWLSWYAEIRETWAHVD